MTRSTFWYRLAEQDLRHAYRHIERSSPRSAERFLDAVEGALETLLDFPGAGRLHRFEATRARGVRTWAIRGYPYLVCYRFDDRRLEVIRILHGARDVRWDAEQT